jgi:hypothetical protein
LLWLQPMLKMPCRGSRILSIRLLGRPPTFRLLSPGARHTSCARARRSSILPQAADSPLRSIWLPSPLHPFGCLSFSDKL